MGTMHEARLHKQLTDGEALCTLCLHDSHAAESGRGACGARYIIGGVGIGGPVAK